MANKRTELHDPLSPPPTPSITKTPPGASPIITQHETSQEPTVPDGFVLTNEKAAHTIDFLPEDLRPSKRQRNAEFQQHEIQGDEDDMHHVLESSSHLDDIIDTHWPTTNGYNSCSWLSSPNPDMFPSRNKTWVELFDNSKVLSIHNPESTNHAIRYGEPNPHDFGMEEYRQLVDLARSQIKGIKKPFRIRLTHQEASGDWDNSRYILSWSKLPDGRWAELRCRTCGGNGNSFGNSSFDFFKGITSLAKHILDAHGQQPIMELGDERHWIFKNCTVRALSTPDFAGTTPREFWLPRRQPELSFIGTALSSRNRSEAR